MTDSDLVITVSGFPGSGTTTIASSLASLYDGTTISGGDIFRDLAAEHDMTEKEFGPYVNQHPELDRQIDERLQQEIIDFKAGEAYSDADALIVESRLAGWLAGDRADFRLWLTAPIDCRADRVNSERDGRTTETKEELKQREHDEKQRYKNFYDVDITDLSIYDLVINTSRWPVPAIEDLIWEATIMHREDRDEGSTPSRDPIATTTLSDAETVK